MNTLTCVERLIIESLGRSEKNVNELHLDTTLSHRILMNILNALTLRGITQQKDGRYSISKHMNPETLCVIKGYLGQKTEALELIESMLSQESIVRLKKVYISEKDKPILNALLNNLNNFFQTLPEAPKNVSLSDFSLFIWGEDQYGKNINRMMKGLL
jgi:hypothetical protein